MRRVPHAPSSPTPVPRPFRGRVTTGVALLVVALLLLSVAVHATRAALPGDLGVAAAVQRLLPDGWLSHPLEWLSVIGWPQYQAGVLVGLVGLLLVLCRRCGTLALVLACGCADGASFLMNRLIQRPRPHAPGLFVDRHITNYYSFPSGHVVHFTVLCGLLLYLTFHPRVTAPWWWPVRALLLVSHVVSRAARDGPNGASYAPLTSVPSWPTA